MMSGCRPAFSSARSTPICAQPRAPPLPSASPMRGRPWGPRASPVIPLRLPAALSRQQRLDAGDDQAELVRHFAARLEKVFARPHREAALDQEVVERGEIAGVVDDARCRRAPASAARPSGPRAPFGSNIRRIQRRLAMSSRPSQPPGSSRIASGRRSAAISTSIEMLSPVTTKPSARPSRPR